MKSVTDYRANWGGGSNLPNIDQRGWNMLFLPALALLLMAVLQVISFGKFKDWIDGIGVGWPAVVAVVVILAEFVGGLSLLKVPMNNMARFLGVSLAVLVSGFWFVETLQVVANGQGERLTNSAFFGKYLSQTPGWWTVVEVSLLLFWLVYAAELLKWRPNSR